MGMKYAKILVVLMVLGLAATTCLARKKKKAIPRLESSLPGYAIAYTLAGLGGIAVIGFKKSKRTHLD